MIKRFLEWFRKWLVRPNETSAPPVVKQQTKVTLTISTAHNRDAFQISTTVPAAIPKETFQDFEAWYANTRGSEHYMIQAENFKTVVCRRFIAGYTVVVTP